MSHKILSAGTQSLSDFLSNVQSPSTMQLREITEASYALFENYTIGNTLSVCKACCITDAEEAELVRTPLRDVSSRLLWHAYYESARNYTDQELWEMKHFLPRVLELVAGFDFPGHSPEIVFTRLDLDKREKWTIAERALLETYSVLLFKKALAVLPEPYNDDAATCLIMFGIAHFNLAPLFAAWEEAGTLESLLHFKALVLNELDFELGIPQKLQNSFATPALSETVLAWLKDARVKSLFAGKIEVVIMEGAGLPEECLEELSRVYAFLTG